MGRNPRVFTSRVFLSDERWGLTIDQPLTFNRINCYPLLRDPLPAYCPKCGAELTDPDDPFCPECLQVVNPPQPEKSSPPQTGDEKEYVQEYRRTCRDCGKVWHSLEWREKKLGEQNTCYSCECNFCGTLFPRSSKDWDVSQDNGQQETRESELERLRSCPSCHSKNYQEEILTYERK
jgi:hypothetical protein